jgi:hypothetical protein
MPLIQRIISIDGTLMHIADMAGTIKQSSCYLGNNDHPHGVRRGSTTVI